MPMVVGIFPSANALSKLGDAIKAADIDLADLIIIADDMPAQGLITSGVRFTLSGEPDTSTLGSGRGIITGSGGTEVPGLDVTPGLGMIGDQMGEALSDLNVPDARIDDYEEALEEGRAVAGIQTADVDKLKGIFTAAGANTVDVF
jgi:hypothetical protein